MENSLNQNKVWGWGELALMYFPNISQKSAITLWDISENPEEVKGER